MGLETVTYISDLDIANPVGSDLKLQGDDHIRNIKKGIKATFPNVSGVVNATHTQLNNVNTLFGDATTPLMAWQAMDQDAQEPIRNYLRLEKFSGEIFQTITGTDAGSSTVSTTNTNLNGSAVQITPLSTDSKLLVRVTFNGVISALSATNTTATFQLSDGTTPFGSPMPFGASSASGGVGLSGSVSLSATIPNTTLAVKQFNVVGKTSSASAACAAYLMKWEITEIRN